MGWSVDLIPIIEGESAEDAVNRTYAGGTGISIRDGEVFVTNILGYSKAFGSVSRIERAWMLATIARLSVLNVGLQARGHERELGRRWPWACDYVSSRAALGVTIYSDHLTLGPFDRPSTDEHWQLWWRVIRAFTSDGFIAYIADLDSILRVPVSYSAKRARQVANLF